MKNLLFNTLLVKRFTERKEQLATKMLFKKNNFRFTNKNCDFYGEIYRPLTFD